MKPIDPKHCGISDVIFISNKNRYERIRKKDILYIEAQGAYVDIYVIDGKMNLSTHLKNFLAQLDDSAFIQISRKHVVNISHVLEIYRESVVVGIQHIPITKMYRSGLMEKVPIIKTK